MKIVRFGFIFGITLSLSCNTNTPSVKTKLPIADTTSFFPVGNFFKSQVQYVELRNFYLYKITVKDGKKDSSRLSKEEFKLWAHTFLDRDNSASTKKSMYKESVFHDLSTHSYTINYASVNKNIDVQNVAVLLDEETNNVKRVFIRTILTRGDTAIIEQSSWKAFKSFQVNRALKTNDGYSSTEYTYINWNDSHNEK